MSLLKPQNIEAVLSKLNPDEQEALKAYFRGGERASFVIHLLEQGLPVADIRQRVMSRYGLARRQAYRVIEDALNLRR